MTTTPDAARAVVADNPDWRDDANCRGMARTWDHAIVDDQRRVCRDCPVARSCLAYAYLHGSREVVHAGVWLKGPLTDSGWLRHDAILTRRQETAA